MKEEIKPSQAPWLIQRIPANRRRQADHRSPFSIQIQQSKLTLPKGKNTRVPTFRKDEKIIVIAVARKTEAQRFFQAMHVQLVAIQERPEPQSRTVISEKEFFQGGTLSKDYAKSFVFNPIGNNFDLRMHNQCVISFRIEIEGGLEEVFAHEPIHVITGQTGRAYPLMLHVQRTIYSIRDKIVVWFKRTLTQGYQTAMRLDGTAFLYLIRTDIIKEYQQKRNITVINFPQLKLIDDFDKTEIDLRNFQLEPSIEWPEGRTIRYTLILECRPNIRGYGGTGTQPIRINIQSILDPDWLDT